MCEHSVFRSLSHANQITHSNIANKKLNLDIRWQIRQLRLEYQLSTPLPIFLSLLLNYPIELCKTVSRSEFQELAAQYEEVRWVAASLTLGR